MNDRVKSDIIILNNVKDLHFQYERDCNNNTVRQYVEQKPLFYHLSNTMLQVYFKSIRKSTKLKFFKTKDELLATLADLDVIASKQETFNELLSRLSNELLLAHNQMLPTTTTRANMFVKPIHSFVSYTIKSGRF